MFMLLPPGRHNATSRAAVSDTPCTLPPARCPAACSAEDRAENIRRIGEVARLFADAGERVAPGAAAPWLAARCCLHDNGT